MAQAYRNIISISEKSTIVKPSDQTLSVNLDPDGLSFALLDEGKFTYLALEDYQINSPAIETDGIGILNDIINSSSLLNASFKKISISCFTSELVLVPAKAYDPIQNKQVFTFCAPLPENHRIMTDKLNILDAWGLYSISEELNSFFEKKFPGHRLKHSGSVFIESTLAAQYLEEWKTDIVIHIKDTYFEIILLENQKLLLYQSFKYYTFDDLLYYMFYVLQEYNMDAATKNLLIMGKVSLDTKTFVTLASFFKKVSFPERNDAFQYIRAFEEIPSHFYYNLLNLVACG